ncbi:hypothetical protein G7054_g8877 [Neopestalotiopsis clavispora]|nr:hypothetical protein G7054_g8877 [Neopestalotiopsis clavispora]
MPLPLPALRGALQVALAVGELVVVKLARAPGRDAQGADGVRGRLLNPLALHLGQEAALDLGGFLVVGGHAAELAHAFHKGGKVFYCRFLSIIQDKKIITFLCSIVEVDKVFFSPPRLESDKRYITSATTRKSVVKTQLDAYREMCQQTLPRARGLKA